MIVDMNKLATRVDGFINRITGLGTDRDKRTAAEIGQAKRLTQEGVDHLYRGNDVAARIVDALPEDALRKPWELSVEEDEGRKQANALLTRADELGVRTALLEGWRWGRAFGGAAVILGVDDGREMKEPLDVESLGNGRPLKVLYLHVVSRWELAVQSWDEDPESTTFGQPMTYTVASSTTPGTGMNIPTIHASRLIRFFGDAVPPHQRTTFDGWGASVLSRPYEVIRDFGASWDGVAHLLQDASQGVYGISNLDEHIGEDYSGLMKRLNVLDKSRSILRAIIVDADAERFERVPTPFSGIPETLQMFILRLCMSARMPATILAGQSPAGMNATGESDIRWWYNRVESEQENTLRPKLERVLRLLAAEQGDPGTSLTVTFPTLWESTPKEEAERRHIAAQTDQVYLETGVYLPEEVAMSRFGARGWSPETSINLEARRELLEADREPAPTGPEGDPVPGQPVPDGGGGEEPVAKNQEAALNGAQVSSMVEITEKVSQGVFPKESGVNMLIASFPISREEAWGIMRPIVVRPPTPEPSQQPPQPPPEPDDSE